MAPFIKITNSEDVLISGSRFDGPGEHIVATGTKNLRTINNTHTDSSAHWVAFTREVLASNLDQAVKQELITEAQTLLTASSANPKAMEGFKAKLRQLVPAAVQFFVSVAAQLAAGTIAPHHPNQ